MTAGLQNLRRRARLGLRAELLIVLPVALLLLVVLSTFTLFSYRGALVSLLEERQAEAERLARGVADHLLTAHGPATVAPISAMAAIAPTAGMPAEQLREMAPTARGVGLLDAAGKTLAAMGELPPLPLPAGPAGHAGNVGPLAVGPVAVGPNAFGPNAVGPVAVGPNADLPDGVAAFVPLVVPSGPGAAAGLPGMPGLPVAPGAVLYARVDLPAATLGAQLRAIALLSWLVLPINSALVLLILLLLRHLLTPYETLLTRARALGEPDDAGEDEAAFLLATLGRALEALGERHQPVSGAGAGGASYLDGTGRAGNVGSMGNLGNVGRGNVGSGGSASDPSAADGRRPDEDLAALERTLATSLGSGLLLLGRDGRVLSLNAPGAVLLGAVPAAANVPLGVLLAPYPELLAILESAIAAGTPVQRRECTLERPGGGALTLGLSVHPLRRDDGLTRGYLVLFADLTEVRRRAEESRLSDRLATLGEMAAGAAHELRNSLATLRGYLTLVERRPDEDSIADFLAEIRHEADHLQRVLEDFLAFARPGTARPRLFSMPELVRRAAADPALAGVAVVVWEAEGPAAEGGKPPESGLLRGDPQLIERALRNVLHNAAQAEREAGRGGPVEVTVVHSPSGIAVEVADRGAGVPAELRNRLFHPFATGRAGGVGLGLALAYRIVTLHGGSIRLDDRPGGGTKARLFFARDTFVTNSNDTLSPGSREAPQESSATGL
jgi:signal transduction histidine kinase